MNLAEYTKRKPYKPIDVLVRKLLADCPEYSLERPPKGKQSNYIINIKEHRLPQKLGKGKSFTWTATTKELRPINADTVFWSAIPSMNPHVVILSIPDDMDYDVAFGNRKQGDLESLGSNHWRLNSMLLPGQALRLRWWRKSDSEKWQKEFDEKHSKKSHQERL